jgi:4a-hydroxytetrahydrobiopterin dehydratase
MVMSEGSARRDGPRQGQAGPLRGDAITALLRQLDGWEVINEHHLSKEYRFPDFVTALAFVNRIGELAEAESHHPDLSLSWGKVGIQLWTHTVDGLGEKDFALAAQIDELAPD